MENRTSSRTFSRKCIIFFIVLIPFQAILLFSGKIHCRNKSHPVHCFPAIKSCSQGQSEAKPLFLPLNLLQRLYIKNSLTVNSLQGFSPYTQEIFLSSLPILSLLNLCSYDFLFKTWGLQLCAEIPGKPPYLCMRHQSSAVIVPHATITNN